MARLLILGAGLGQVDLINAAKQYGHTAVVATIPGNYPGIACADEVVYVDISNPEQVEEVVRTRDIQGICTCCFDTAMASLGYACDKHGLNGISFEAGKTARDKVLMKEKMIAAGVRTPSYLKISCEADLDEISNRLQFPVIIKPVDQQGSLGVSLAPTPADLSEAYRNATANTQSGYSMAEEFIDGEKHGANGCVVNGDILFLLPSEDLTKGSSVLGHVFPFDVDQALYDEIIDQSVRALHATGIDNCIFNVDYMIKDNQVYILEITGRMGANGIPQLLSIYYHIDIYKLLIDLSLGNNVDAYRFGLNYAGTPCCSKMLISDKSGILKEIRDVNVCSESIVNCTFFVSNGAFINSYKSAKDCIGQIIVKADTPKQSKKRAQEVEKNILFILEE